MLTHRNLNDCIIAPVLMLDNFLSFEMGNNECNKPFSNNPYGLPHMVCYLNAPAGHLNDVSTNKKNI